MDEKASEDTVVGHSGCIAMPPLTKGSVPCVVESPPQPSQFGQDPRTSPVTPVTATLTTSRIGRNRPFGSSAIDHVECARPGQCDALKERGSAPGGSLLMFGNAHDAVRTSAAMYAAMCEAQPEADAVGIVFAVGSKQASRERSQFSFGPDDRARVTRAPFGAVRDPR
jgi:hypothetical protein